MSKAPVPTTTSPYWVEQARLRRIREANDILAEQQEEEDRLNLVPLPCRVTPEGRADIVIAPGNQHAQAATKEGREDEYIDRMRSKFGGEW